MIRNLVVKLPSFTCSSELRQRTFRSLSPVDRFGQNKIRKSSETSLSSRPLNRTVTYTKEDFNKNTQEENQDEEPPKIIKWREQPQKRKPKSAKTVEVKEETIEVHEEPQAPPVQYYEQYELEAARPRPVKSTEIIDRLRAKPTQSMFGTQLQPNELLPYGSHDNVFSFNLIASPGVKGLRKKVIRKEIVEDTCNARNNPSRRSYSTSVKPQVIEQEEEFQEQVDKNQVNTLKNLNTNFDINMHQRKLKATPTPAHLDINPPNFKVLNDEKINFVQFSSQEAFRQRREQANREAAAHYKMSYSDLIKMRQRNESNEETLTQDVSNSGKHCVECVNAPKRNKQLLNPKETTPVSTPTTDKRNMSTYNRINILNEASNLQISKPRTPVSTPATDKRNMSTNNKTNILNKIAEGKKELECRNSLLKPVNSIQLQTAQFSKSKDKKPNKNSKCYDPCKEQKERQKPAQRSPPLEPKDIDCNDGPKQKVFLASKVRLPVVKCLPKFEYDCKVPEPCPPRADECLKVLPKRLPVMTPKECPCVEQPLKDVPRLRRLCFEFKDPVREKCYQEPCTIPRADDANPYKFKPLPKLEMGECECIEPPQMTDVKIKRLPPCEPEDVCWPVREPCIPEPCPPRADVCLKVARKRLPVMEPKPCPCVEPPPMTAPSLSRLCLHVPEPKRVCPPPPVCECKVRADKCFKPKRKVLPKFVPGDCPCIDRPMTDVKLKRLECVDEPRCIVTIPDHCQPYPRADYGCWEFEEDTCYEVPEECITRKPDPCDPPKCKDPCERRDICKTSGPLNVNPRRRYNTDSTSMRLFNKIKNKNANNINTSAEKKNITSEAVVNKNVTKTNTPKLDIVLKRNSSLPTFLLLKELDKISTKDGPKSIQFDARNRKTIPNQVDYSSILKKIKSTSEIINKKKTAKITSLPLCISSRAISTSQAAENHEKQIRDAKNLACKKKCQNLKPKTLCHARGIKGGLLCGQTKCKDTNMCKKERVPVCCEKEEAPYAAFSDKIYDMNVNPYKDLNHCHKCLKSRFPCVPDYTPKCEKRKFFSTSAMIHDLPVDQRIAQGPPSAAATNKMSRVNSLFGALGISPKGTLSSPTLATPSRSYATKVFKIKKPEIVCDDFKSTKPAEKIMCINYDHDPCQTTKKSCKRIFYEKTDEKIKTPYPAFSDCLDEDMEYILSECPLERDKYTQLQPRHIPPSNNEKTKIDPPKTEPLDLLKEQHCIKARLGQYEGTSQNCETFGNKMKLLKSRDIFKEPNKDCERIVQLKKEGRWPPLTLKQNRHPFSTFTCVQSREFSTFAGGLNAIHELANDNSHNEGKRIYIRNYHSLIKNSDKSIFNNEVENKVKELTLKQFPDANDSCKLLKLKNDQWRKENLKKFSKLNQRVNLPSRVKRFYTSYKIKSKNYLKKSTRNVSSKAVSMQRKISDSQVKYFKPQDEKQCKRSNRKCSPDGSCPKFRLNNCPLPTERSCKKGFFAKECTKPNTPYPSFSECGEHDISGPFCECPMDSQQLDDLQPNASVLPVIEKKHYPTEDKIDTTLAREYCRQKMGIQKSLTTLDCKSFPEYFAAKKAKKVYKIKAKVTEPKSREQIRERSTKPPQKANCKDDDVYNVEIECVIADKKNKPPCDPCRDLQACCSQILEKDKCEEVEPKKPVVPPCCLPEEDRACREYCKKIVLSEKLNPEEERYRDFCKKIICYENSDAYNKKPEKLYEDERICKNTSKDVKQFCKQVVDVETKDVPKTVSGISEECAQKLLQDCEKIAHLAEKCLKKYQEEQCKVPEKPEPKVEVTCKPECEEPIKPKCPKFKIPCAENELKTEVQTAPTLSLWQKFINYFKARPGCPEPGDWKKKALNDKAHKAAAAAGLVAVDPKCLPSDVVKQARSDPCCRACPSEQPICKPPEVKTEDDICKKPKVAKSSAAGKKGKFGMFRRNYSKSFSWTNLEEINKILEEDRQKKSIRRSSKYLNKEFGFVSKNKQHTYQIKKSLDYQNKPFPIRVTTVSKNHSERSKTYFGYTNILPSRENVLERAWRLSMEEAKKRQGEVQAVSFLNEIFKKVEDSVQSQEDLEKMKTENVLRELDRFLKLKEDANSEDNKK